MTEKEIYEVVKYFKSIYTTINMSDEIYLVGSDSGAFIYYKNEPYFLLYGKLVDKDNSFMQWLKGKKTTVTLQDLNSLRECLKKNVVDINTTDFELILKYKNKEETEMSFRCENKANPVYENTIEKIRVISKSLTGKLDISQDLLDNDVLELYLNNGNDQLTESRNDNKLIEIPSKRILSNQKNATEHSVRFSEKDESGRRYVQISSSSELIELYQIYATI
jgi:hypothetical protein